MYEECALFRTINMAKIKNSEGIKNIDVGTFIENIWENTGIYQMIHMKTVAERAAEQTTAATSTAKQAHNPFAGSQVPAWYSLIMIASSFFYVFEIYRQLYIAEFCTGKSIFSYRGYFFIEFKVGERCA